MRLYFSFWVTKMFSESLAWSSSCFAHIYLFATSASYAINDMTWCYDKFFVNTSWISKCKYLTNETARINSPQTWVSNTFIKWIWYWWKSASLASLQSWNTWNTKQSNTRILRRLKRGTVWVKWFAKKQDTIIWTGLQPRLPNLGLVVKRDENATQWINC